MTIDAGDSAVARADQVVDDLIEAAHKGTHRARLTKAPAGAGKTGAVVRLVGSLGTSGKRVGVVAQTNEQAFDIVDRLSFDQPDLEVAFMPKANLAIPEVLVDRSNVEVIKAKDIDDHDLVIATGHKWAYTAPQVEDNSFDHGVIDEMYQMSSAMLLRSSSLFASVDGLGDPGQLEPFTTVDDERWAGHATDPTLNAVDALLANRNDVRIASLPVTRRLPPSAASIVGDAFYPDLEFSPSSAEGDRELQFAKALKGRKPIRATLQTAAETGWGLLELPPAVTRRTDMELVGSVVDLVETFRAGQPEVLDEKLGAGVHAVEANRIAIGVAHNDQKSALLVELQGRGLDDVIVDTANRLQGREFDVTIVWHPLSGRIDASEFHLDCGRLCVLTTRHRHACIVVARSGVEQVLADHPPPGSLRLGVKRDRTFEGWDAHRELLARLIDHRVSL